MKSAHTNHPSINLYISKIRQQTGFFKWTQIAIGAKSRDIYVVYIRCGRIRDYPDEPMI